MYSVVIYTTYRCLILVLTFVPVTAPDTVDRLKKGIKGLFGKNKKSKDSEPSKSPGDSSKVETSQPSATQLEPAKPAETSKPIEDQPTPSGADSSTADNKDLGDPGKDAQASADVTGTQTAISLPFQRV